jgi:hypothetical protein
MFFFGNKGDHTLQRLICTVPPSGQFSFQQGPVPTQLEPKRQIQVCCDRFDADSVRSFPRLCFCSSISAIVNSFLIGSAYHIPIADGVVAGTHTHTHTRCRAQT